MFYPMGAFRAHTRPSLIYTHESSCHVSQLPVVALRILDSSLVQMSLCSLCLLSFLVSHDVAIYYMLDLVDPYGRHYGLPLDIILLELVLFDHSLLPFLLVYFFIARRSRSTVSHN